MQANAIRVKYETLRSLAFGSVGAAYVGVGAAFANPVRILKVTNTTDADLLVSFDGVTDMDVVPAQSYYLYDYTSNNSLSGGIFEQASGQRLYVKEAAGAPTLGSVYVTVIFAST